MAFGKALGPALSSLRFATLIRSLRPSSVASLPGRGKRDKTGLRPVPPPEGGALWNSAETPKQLRRNCPAPNPYPSDSMTLWSLRLSWPGRGPKAGGAVSAISSRAADKKDNSWDPESATKDAIFGYFYLLKQSTFAGAKSGARNGVFFEACGHLCTFAT